MLAILRIVGAVIPEAFTLVAIGGGFVYNGLLDGGPAGRTLGKRLLRLRVIDNGTGHLIGPQRGLMRALPPLAFGVLGILGPATFSLAIIASMLDGLWPLWDRQRQAWHDKVAGSVVVKIGTLEGS